MRGEIMPSNRGIPSSEQDLMQMQQDAVRRVREMQERSRIAVENANQSLHTSARQEERAHQQRREPENIEHNEPQKRKLKTPHNPILRNKSSNSILPFDFNIGELTKSLTYEDFMLIGLIILLITEEADEMLILALVYILVTELELFGE